ncbi:VOC family protein [Gordonia sp. CPCC 206044]|uniref:VOC family protein n=1 Tax=Gordonia sp. CPCC 206044 TaxID=3140793 RepID=UPI003AF3A895
MRAEDLFHVGVVTNDSEATRQSLSALLGYEWGPDVGSQVEVMTPGGPIATVMSCSFSVQTPRIEVVTEVPGTMWTGGGGVHHLGYWSDDVAADLGVLEESGFVREAVRTGPDGEPFFAFCRNDSGLRLELVTRAAEPGLSQCWSGPGR